MNGMATKKTLSNTAKSSQSAAKPATAKLGGATGKTRQKVAKTTPSPRRSVTATTKSAQANNPTKKDEIPAVQSAAPVTTSKQRAAKKRNESDADFFIKKKVVRDTFTMPIADYEKIDALKKKCLHTGVVVKKSELLRAGLAALELLSTEDLARTVGAVHALKSGRPVSRRQQKAKNDDK
jgi:hypothetical protein